MISKFNVALLCAASTIAMSAAAHAQGKDVEAVTVTGSRVISDITLSPTPLTVVTSDQLLATTPTDIPDALNKLPVFIGGRTPRSQDNASRNTSGNVLSLRNFGVSRTLILLDGHRVPASNQDGTVDVDTLPQMLMSRVDVVTGGASAVYGSDAVAGVVNFVLDKKFEGFKYNLNAGISKYADAAEEQLGIAWGTQLWGGRGHFEMAARYFNQDMVPIDARPYGFNNNTWTRAGSGSASQPYVNVPFGHTFNQSAHGTVNCGTGCAFNNYTFNQPGVLSPMVHGVPTTTANLEQGGDGGYNPVGTFRSKLRTAELFGRLSYDITDDINGYIQGSWAESGNFANWSPAVVSSAGSRPNAFFANNPYLSAQAQAQLGTGTIFMPAPKTATQNGTTPPASPATPIFTAPSYAFNMIGGQSARSQGRIYNTSGLDRNLGMEAGLTGTLGKFAWDAYFNHGESRVHVKNPNNTDNARYLAAEDAVIAPPGTKIPVAGSTTGATQDVSGTIQCWVTTQAAYASLYPGCQPLNLFDPAGPSAAAFDWISKPTWWDLTQVQDSLGGSLSGGLWGIGLPAGEITASVSGVARWNTYTMGSKFAPTEFVDCTGLRLCLANNGNPTAAAANTAAPVKWTQNVNAPVDVSNNVFEIGTEINVPLLKNVPMFQDLSLNVAGRYANYSTSGEALTWKVGGDWHINDTLRFRSTMSVDIRAPNLNDLYQPVGISSTGFTDLLTGGNNSTQLVTKGTSTLKPEVAHSYTLGMVLTPDFIPGLTASVDWYETHMSDAIGFVSYQSTTVQNICLATAPTYNSAYCSLAVRPIAVGGAGYTTTNNFPLQVLSSPLNSAKVQMEGWDVEVDYNFELADVWDALPGSVNIRHLATYQPVNTTFALPGAAPTWAVAPKTRMTTFLQYQLGDWGLSMQNQWLSGFKKAASATEIYAAGQTRVGSYNVLDVTIDKKIDMWGGSSDLYFNVSNIGNTRAPLFPTNASNPGLFYPTAGFHDDMGRYFTIGLRGNL